MNDSTYPTSMKQKMILKTSTIVAPILFAAVCCFSFPAIAQSSSSKSDTTWQDLGFSQIPEGFSTDKIPLFEGLNKSRGTWSFKGKRDAAQDAKPLEGSLLIQGNPKAGMIPIWRMDWLWPADDPEQMIVYNILASPKKSGFDLMLVRIGPMKPGANKNQQGIQRIAFQGTWNLENRIITWTESDLPNRLGAKSTEEEDSEKPKQTFEMAVAADGKISIQNSKHTSQDQLVSGKAVARTGKAKADPVVLTGKHKFQTVAEVFDRRIKPWLPPQATEISLLSERGGHFARYKISEAEFKKFIDQLWEAGKDSSAHQRDRMGGEGELAKQEAMARRFKAAGWEPLENAITYYSPSKSSGAMTTYYYDREAGIAYHDRGYW